MEKGKIVKMPSKQLSVEVSVKDIEVVKGIIDVLSELSQDERIDQSIRSEYEKRIVGIVKKDR